MGAGVASLYLAKLQTSLNSLRVTPRPFLREAEKDLPQHFWGLGAFLPPSPPLQLRTMSPISVALNEFQGGSLYHLHLFTM